MAASTTVNGKTVVHSESGGAVATFPDVCLTPTPGGPVPVPYPNLARSADLAGGTRTVTVDGVPIAVEGSVFGRSTGDEPGTQKGVLSRAQGGEARFLNWSFDVKVEGRGVCRLMDPMASNGGSPTNTPPAAEVQPPLVVPPVSSPDLRSVHRLRVRPVYAPDNVYTDVPENASVFSTGYRLQSIPGAAVVDFNRDHEQYAWGESDVPDEGAYALTFFPFSFAERPLKTALPKGRGAGVLRHLASETKRTAADLEEASDRLKRRTRRSAPSDPDAGLAKGRIDTARTRLTEAHELAKEGDGERAPATAGAVLGKIEEAEHELEAAASLLRRSEGRADDAGEADREAVRDALAATAALRLDLQHDLASPP